jgi:hypothetical protein
MVYIRIYRVRFHIIIYSLNYSTLMKLFDRNLLQVLNTNSYIFIILAFTLPF